MKSAYPIFVFLSIVVAGCYSKPASSEQQVSDTTTLPSPSDGKPVAQSSGNPDIDSILHDYDLEGPITLIEKRYAENAAQYAFIIYRTRTQQHKRLAQLFDFQEGDREEYNAQYSRMKNDSIETVSPPAEIKGAWLPVFWYNDKPYVVWPCEMYGRVIVTDSTFVRWEMDGIVPEPIVAIEKENNQITIEAGKGRTYHLALSDASHSIYRLSGDEVGYLVPLAKASELPMIVEHCTVDGGISVDYEFKPPSDR